MKKINLIGMFALTFALVFGAVACSNDSGSSGSSGTNIADVELKDLELKGKWKCTEFEVTLYEPEDKEAFKEWFGYEYVAPTATATASDDALSIYDEEFDTEEEAQNWFKARQTEAKAYEKITDPDKSWETSAKAMCELKGFEYVSSEAAGESSWTLDGDSKYTEEFTSESTITFKKGDKEYTVNPSLFTSSVQVWEKQ